MSVRSSSMRRRARSSGSSPPAMGSSVASTVSLPRFDPDAGSTAWSVSTCSARSDSSSTPGVDSRDRSPDVVTFGSSVGALVDDHESSGSENDSSWSCLMGSAGSVASGAFSPATRAAASRSASVMDGTVPSSAGASEASGVPQVQVNSSVEASAFAVSDRVDGDEDASSRLSTTNTRGSSDDGGSVVTSSPSPGTGVGDS